MTKFSSLLHVLVLLWGNHVDVVSKVTQSFFFSPCFVTVMGQSCRT